MAKAVALLFLLDSMSDFNNVINQTLHKFAPGMTGVTCDPTITAPVLQVIGRKLNLTDNSIEILQNIDPLPKSRYDSHKVQEMSPELVNHISVLDNLLESYEVSIENSPYFIEHNYKKVNTKEKNVVTSSGLADLTKGINETAKENEVTSVLQDVAKDLNVTKNENSKPLASKSTEEKGKIPGRAPFLAAIFETVGNVTAQTCGGVVLLPHWVLTAASCVNVLGPFYSKSSSEATENYYSVIAGAKNPLEDGTVHQVSKIFLNPTPSNNVLSSVLGVANAAPSLALLRVEPRIDVGMTKIIEKNIWDGTSTLYGWDLLQNETSFNMTSISIPARHISPAECQKSYGVAQNNNTLCLMVNETAANHTRMSSGCPIVTTSQDGRPALVAVALTDGTQPLLASPLSSHHDWLVRLTSNYGKVTENIQKK